MCQRTCARMYKRGRRPIPAPDIIPTTVLQRRTWRARARTRLVGGVRSGARAHRGLAPFLRSFHYYHIDTLSVFLSSSTTPTVLLTRAFSLFPIRLLFLVFFYAPGREETVCHMTISDENIVEWLLDLFRGFGKQRRIGHRR